MLGRVQVPPSPLCSMHLPGESQKFLPGLGTQRWELCPGPSLPMRTSMACVPRQADSLLLARPDGSPPPPQGPGCSSLPSSLSLTLLSSVVILLHKINELWVGSFPRSRKHAEVRATGCVAPHFRGSAAVRGEHFLTVWAQKCQLACAVVPTVPILLHEGQVKAQGSTVPPERMGWGLRWWDGTLGYSLPPVQRGQRAKSRDVL